MKMIKVFLTGSTGMVGEGVLHECLLSHLVESVLVINRRPCGVKHPKLQEIIHHDFLNLSAFSTELAACNACFFCLGISSIGLKPDLYFRTTYTITLYIGELLSRLNTDMTFCYISGAGTNMEGSAAWARVKGKTENDLQELPFRQVFCFRPGAIRPLPGLKNVPSLYKYIGWIFPIGRILYPAGFCKMEELGRSMIHVVNDGYPKQVLEGLDIIKAGSLS